MAQADSTSTTRRQLLRTAALALPALALSAAALAAMLADPDPIFAAIARNTQAYRAYRARLDNAGPDLDSVAESELTALYEVHAATLEDLLSDVPASLAGLTAWIAHLRAINLAYELDGSAEEIGLFDLIDVDAVLRIIQSVILKSTKASGS